MATSQSSASSERARLAGLVSQACSFEPISGAIQRPTMRSGTCSALMMTAELVGERVEGAGHEADRAVGQVARTAPGDLSAPTSDQAGHLDHALARHDGVERVGDRGESVDARATLPRALLGEVLRDARRFGQAARSRGKRVQHATSERGAGLLQLQVSE